MSRADTSNYDYAEPSVHDQSMDIQRLPGTRQGIG
tara:strand:+ start:9988 stop:10092 length:105 start_codon:yes stop_codon:yes gene_type:complete